VWRLRREEPGEDGQDQHRRAYERGQDPAAPPPLRHGDLGRGLPASGRSSISVGAACAVVSPAGPRPSDAGSGSTGGGVSLDEPPHAATETSATSNGTRAGMERSARGMALRTLPRGEAREYRGPC